MSNSTAPGSSAAVNVRVTALTTNPNVPVTYKTIILKKNLVNGVNTLTQAMMNQANTKYVIKYDYILGEDITVPANCVLEFDGGSLSNGILNTNNCEIIDTYSKIFNNVSLYTIHYGAVIKVNSDYIKSETVELFDIISNTIVPVNTPILIHRAAKIDDVISLTSATESITVYGETVQLILNGHINWNISRVRIVDSNGVLLQEVPSDFAGCTAYIIDTIYITYYKVKNSIVRPEWFGAKADNTTDDSNAINAAIKLASGNSGKVIKPVGECKITNPIILSRNVLFEGNAAQAWDRDNLVYDGQEMAVLIQNLENNGVFGLYIENLNILCNKNATGLEFRNAGACGVFKNIHIRNANYGLRFNCYGYITAVSIEQISCDGCNYGIDCFSPKSTIAFCNANKINYNYVTTEYESIHIKGCRGLTLVGDNSEAYSSSRYCIKIESSIVRIEGFQWNESSRFINATDHSIVSMPNDPYGMGLIDKDDTSIITTKPFNCQRVFSGKDSILEISGLEKFIKFDLKTKSFVDYKNQIEYLPIENHHGDIYENRISTYDGLECLLGAESFNCGDLTGKTIVLGLIHSGEITDVWKNNILINEEYYLISPYNGGSIIYYRGNNIGLYDAYCGIVVIAFDSSHVYINGTKADRDISQTSWNIGYIFSIEATHLINKFKIYNRLITDNTEIAKLNLQFWSEDTNQERPITFKPNNPIIGYCYFDGNAPIWYKGNNVWVDATGATV